MNRASDLRYRKATVDDCRALAELKGAVWNTTYQGIYSAETLANYDVVKNQHIFEGIVADPDIELYLAECGGKPVGLMTCGKPFKPFQHFQQEIGLLYILKEYQRRGIGRGFFDLARQQVKNSGHHEFLVSVNKLNRPAIDFYLAMGGRVILTDEKKMKIAYSV